MEVIILVGGKGTRLRSVISDLPKPMAPVNGIPFLQHLLDQLNNKDVKKVVLAVGYKKEKIENYFKNKYKNIEIEYSIEDEPLGTGGAIKNALEKTKEENIIVLNGDTYTDINFEDMLEQHKNNKADLTIAVKTMEKFDRYGQVLSEDGKIIGFKEKEFCEKGNINTGVYILKRNFFKKLDLKSSFSFENDVMEKYFNKMNFFQYLSETVFIDIGIPKDYERVGDYIL